MTVQEIEYFLYKNQTEGAADAIDDVNTFIVADINELCEYNGVYMDSDSE